MITGSIAFRLWEAEHHRGVDVLEKSCSTHSSWKHREGETLCSLHRHDLDDYFSLLSLPPNNTLSQDLYNQITSQYCHNLGTMPQHMSLRVFNIQMVPLTDEKSVEKS